MIFFSSVAMFSLSVMFPFKAWASMIFQIFLRVKVEITRTQITTVGRLRGVRMQCCAKRTCTRRKERDGYFPDSAWNFPGLLMPTLNYQFSFLATCTSSSFPSTMLTESFRERGAAFSGFPAKFENIFFYLNFAHLNIRLNR